jgi:hypothetical protein
MCEAKPEMMPNGKNALGLMPHNVISTAPTWFEYKNAILVRKSAAGRKNAEILPHIKVTHLKSKDNFMTADKIEIPKKKSHKKVLLYLPNCFP